jgi:hypothetical protein
MDLANKNIDSNISYNYQLDLFINLENTNDIDVKNKLLLELKNSIIPEWKFQKSIKDDVFINNHKFIYKQTNFDDFNPNKLDNANKLDNPNDFYNHISNGISNTNYLNEFNPEIIFDQEKIKILNKLNNYGIQFDMRFNENYKINIGSGEALFPMCCVGKNRSQYMFYYLKKMQSESKKNFIVGYPCSGDELSVIVEHISKSINGHEENKKKSNPNVLSSFFPQYKKDNFSIVIAESLDITNLDGFVGVSRSIHIFDKILKIKEDYLSNEFKNLETHKYKQNKFDIYNTNPSHPENLKIKMLFEKYFLFPSNLIQIINSNANSYTNSDESKSINKITYICMSDKSFYNLIKCFNCIVSKYPDINYYNVRIIYFGIKDIFQKSNIKQDEINDFKSIIDSGFCL